MERCASMTDGKIEYVLYGVENQAEIHYAMAVKNNLYDALEYAGQVEKIARAHRKNRKQSLGQNGKETYDEKERKIDMCQAILEMRKESEEIGEKKGIKIGELKRARESARRLYEMGIRVERVAEGVGCDVETVKKWLELPQ